MNAPIDRTVQAWLASRDPGGAPSRLRIAVDMIPQSHSRSVVAALRTATLRSLGFSPTVRGVALLLLLLAAAAVVVGAATLRPWAPWPPPGLIAFKAPSAAVGSTGIRLATADGRTSVMVSSTAPNVLDLSPRWSADGKTLAFGRTTDLGAFSTCVGRGSIVLYDVASATERVVATGLRPVGGVEWSPSGDRIGFLNPEPGCGAATDIGTVDLATGSVSIERVTEFAGGQWRISWVGDDLRAIASTDGEEPVADATSPDGAYIARATPFRDPAARVRIEAAGGGLVADLGPGGGPAWSADGKRLAFIAFPTLPSGAVSILNRLAIVDVATWHVRLVADVNFADGISDFGSRPTMPRLGWTSDGRAVYWLDNAGPWVVEVDGDRIMTLPETFRGCDDLQWQPTPG